MPTAYLGDPIGHVYFFAALLVLGAGGGVALYERFTPASRRFLVLAGIGASWMSALGMAALAFDPETSRVWLRVAFIADPFTAPALYALALSLSGVRRPAVQRTLVAVGGLFAAASVAGPWVVQGLQQATREYTLTGLGWLGALYFLFVVTGVTLALYELWRSGVLTAARELQLEFRVLALVGGVASLTLLDYWLPNEPYRVGLLTPASVGGAALLASLAAWRYRTFAILSRFGTDEVLRALGDIIVVCDGSGRVRAANLAAQRLLGKAERQLVGVPAGTLLFNRPGEAPWIPEPAEVVRAVRLFLEPAEGPPVPVSVTTEPMVRGGIVVGSVIVARDLREQLRTQGALEEAERKFRAVFEYNPGIVYEIGPDGKMLNVNPAGEVLMGQPRDELVGRLFTDLVIPEDQPQGLAAFKEILSGQPGEYELGLQTADGRVRRIRGIGVPVQDGAQIVGIVGVALDVTEESRAKQDLEVQRRYYAELFEASPEAVALVGADGRVRRVNGEFTRLFGYSREEVAGRHLDELIVPDDLREEGEELTREALTGGLARAETVRRRKLGGRVDVSLLAREVRIPGEPPQMYAIYRDVTDRRLAERRLRDREEELRHAQKLEAVGKLAGGIAHDFNNLLTVINGHARFLLEQAGVAEELRGDLAEIEGAGSRAAALTQQLLAFSRRQVLRPQVLDLHAVILELQRMLGRLIGEHISLVTDLRAADARVHADRGQLDQVVMNLVVNARDAMPKGGTLTLATRVTHLGPGSPEVARWEIGPGTYVMLEVCDTGHGIPPENLERVFEPFFTTKERGKGTGLGLSTVFGIVKQTGGHVTAESTAGEGTTFRLLLPLASADMEDLPTAAEAGGATSAGEGRTILVVEDESAVRKLAVRVLERAGHTVLQAANGIEALAILDREPGVSAVVTDLVMPEMGGRELRASLLRRRPDLPVVFMSGYDEEQALEGIAEGDRFLPKPFTPGALTDTVAAALEVAPGGG